ncbi:unnamed protein product [Symbiodinium natans]|uniref:CCHC-type domain-containing protein n=1 Tax=Symbiodinium natans TaxID=878477 RepID=A0A812SH42_9DINO|nr:unnamed protein product [Symbiodinium natans]
MLIDNVKYLGCWTDDFLLMNLEEMRLEVGCRQLLIRGCLLVDVLKGHTLPLRRLLRRTWQLVQLAKTMGAMGAAAGLASGAAESSSTWGPTTFPTTFAPTPPWPFAPAMSSGWPPPGHGGPSLTSTTPPPRTWSTSGDVRDAASPNVGRAPVPSGVQSASEATARLDQKASEEAPRQLESAFEVLGMKPPPSVATRQGPDQAERFIAALTGEKRSIPSWSGQPGTLRTWLKLLAHWEAETAVGKEKWGIRLYQSFPESSEPRKFADQIPLEKVLSPAGYGMILTVIMNKYKPFLDVAGPTAVDKYFFTGERQKGQSFATYIAQKETSRQDMESHLGERLNDKVAGRILLRHAQLSEFQRELVALRDMNCLMGFEEVARLLRPLDRPDLIAQAASAELGGGQAAKHYPVMNQAEEEDFSHEDDEDYEYHEDDDEEDEMAELEDGEMLYEDKEFEEDEAIFLQAYHTAYTDVRRDMQARRKERGFIRHGRTASKGKGKRGRSREGKGGRRREGKGRTSSSRMVRGSKEDLAARTKCYNCRELGHMARDCPLKGSGKGQGRQVNFVVCRGSATTTSTFMTNNTTSVPLESPVNRQVHIYAGVSVKPHEALVDTAAEDAVIGDRALAVMEKELALHGLQVRKVDQGVAPCAGIGGAAHPKYMVDVPTSMLGILGLV